ncbi:MAG: hypothetical protein AAFR65_15510 [Pseudomonadota bacterium]
MRTMFAALAAAFMLPGAASAAAVVQFNGAAGAIAPSYTFFGTTFSTLLGTDVEFDFLDGNAALKDSAEASPILVVFDGVVDGTVAVDVGDNGGDEDSLFLRLFDVTGQLLDEDTDTLRSGETGSRTLITAASNVAFAIIGGVGAGGMSSVLIDNFTLSGLPQPVPAPAPGGILLFATGTIALAFRGRSGSQR